MNRFFDEYLLALSNWEHVGYLIALYLVLCVPAVLGFMYFWFLGVKIWFRGAKEAWRPGSCGSRGPNTLLNPIFVPFMMALLKGALFWLIAGWPLVLTTMELASEDAFKVILSGVFKSNPG